MCAVELCGNSVCILQKQKRQKHSSTTKYNYYVTYYVLHNFATKQKHKQQQHIFNKMSPLRDGFDNGHIILYTYVLYMCLYFYTLLLLNICYIYQYIYKTVVSTLYIVYNSSQQQQKQYTYAKLRCFLFRNFVYLLILAFISLFVVSYIWYVQAYTYNIFLLHIYNSSIRKYYITTHII